MLNWLLEKLQKRAQTLVARQRKLDRNGSSSDGIDVLVREGYRLHSTGDLDGAEAVYRKILYRQPGHADTLYLLGEVCQSKGAYDQAIVLINKAVAVNPNIGAFHASLGSLYKRTKNFLAAESCFREAIRLDEANFEYLNDLGAVLQDQRRFQEALECYERALMLKPDLAQALYNTGMIYRQQGQVDEGARLMERGLALAPDYIEGFLELGHTYLQLERHEQALECYKKALSATSLLDLPNDRVIEANFEYGNLLLGKQQVKDAIIHYLRALDMDQDKYGTWANLGNAYKELKQYEDAINCQMKAIRLQPEQAQPYGNLGLALKEFGDCRRAKEVYQEIIEIIPSANLPAIVQNDPYCELEVALNLIDHALSINDKGADFYLNKGVILEEMGRYAEAEECFDKTIALNSALTHGHFNKGIAALRQGRLKEGWEGYEARLRLEQFLNVSHLTAAPFWTGEVLSDKVLLVHAEQGLGDTIQFIRYYKEVAARCQHVIIECPEVVKSLVEEISGSNNVYAAGTSLPKFDYQIPLLSLPRIFGTELDSIPAAIPYVHSDEVKAAYWSREVARYPGLRVGLVWAGGAVFAGNRFRSTSLSVFTSLATVQGVNFFSLQKGDPVKEAKNPPTGMIVLNWSDRLQDFRDTAALIANLDLVITVDTSVAHLAGAMGKPVWVLVPFCSDWRWMLDRTDSPWYPSMRLFRQSQIGDWAGCMEHVRTELAALALGRQ